MSLPAWYETYLLLHQAKVYPFNEITSVPFMSDVWNVNSVFLTPTDWNSPPPALAPYSLLPSAFDTLSGQPNEREYRAHVSIIYSLLRILFPSRACII